MKDFNKIIPPEEASRAFQEWMSGIEEEIIFWDGVCKEGTKNLKKRINVKNNIVAPEWVFPGLQKHLASVKQTKVKILDVGAGPLSVLGYKNDAGKEIEITACDPLATAYKMIMDKHKITPPTKTVFADGENLSLFFEPNSFDIACARNSLDHSYNPMQIIMQMLFVVKNGGEVFLSHFENEAEAGNYNGLHQWNFINDGSDMIIWNKNYRFSLQGILGDCAIVKSEREKIADVYNPKKQPFIWTNIKKIKNFELGDKSSFVNDIHLKYNIAIDSFVKDKINVIWEKHKIQTLEKLENSQTKNLEKLEKELKRKLRFIKKAVMFVVVAIIALGATILLK